MKITKSYLKQIIKEEIDNLQEAQPQAMALAQPGEHVSKSFERMSQQQLANIIFQRLDKAQRPFSAIEEFIQNGAFKVLNDKTENKHRIIDNANMLLDYKKGSSAEYPEETAGFKGIYRNFKHIFQLIAQSN